jgi:peptide/nickel transport system substrate-binding protein
LGGETGDSPPCGRSRGARIAVYPRSPFRPSDAATNPYPFSVRDAISLLKAHGWNVTPDGTDTCAKPGTGPGECGAGIPAGTKLSFNFIYNAAASVSQQARDLASDARQAGIRLNLSASSFNYMISTTTPRSSGT